MLNNHFILLSSCCDAINKAMDTAFVGHIGGGGYIYSVTRLHSKAQNTYSAYSAYSTYSYCNTYSAGQDQIYFSEFVLCHLDGHCVFAQRGHSANYYVVYPGKTPLKTTHLEKHARSIQNSIGGAEFRILP